MAHVGLYIGLIGYTAIGAKVNMFHVNLSGPLDFWVMKEIILLPRPKHRLLQIQRGKWNKTIRTIFHFNYLKVGAILLKM